MLVTDGTTLHLLGFPPNGTLCGYEITGDDVRAGTWQEVGLIGVVGWNLPPCALCARFMELVTAANLD